MAAVPPAASQAAAAAPAAQVPDAEPVEQKEEPANPWAGIVDDPPPAPAPGFLGNLSDDQQAALDQMRASLPTDLQHTEGSPGDDAELLRFLRARQFKAEDALAMYLAMKAWRAELRVDSILERPLKHADLLQKILPHSIHGVSRLGNPVYVEKTGLVDPQALLTLVTEEDCIEAHVYLQELRMRRCRELSAELGRNIDSVVVVLDLSGLGVAHRKVVHFIKLLAEVDSNMYPESMHTVLIHSAPWIFPTLWGICKGWIDRRTRDKIKMISGDPFETLRQYIDPSQLPREFQGTCEQCPRNVAGCTPQSVGNCIPEFSMDQLELAGGGLAMDLELQSQKICSGQRFQTEVRVESCGENFVVGWFWKLVGGSDVGFGVEFFPEDSPEHPVVVVEPIRIRKDQGRPLEGSFAPPGRGVVRLTWDNSFSWVRGKEIRFVVTQSGGQAMPGEGSKASDETPEAAVAAAGDCEAEEGKLPEQ